MRSLFECPRPTALFRSFSHCRCTKSVLTAQFQSASRSLWEFGRSSTAWSHLFASDPYQSTSSFRLQRAKRVGPTSSTICSVWLRRLPWVYGHPNWAWWFLTLILRFSVAVPSSSQSQFLWNTHAILAFRSRKVLQEGRFIRVGSLNL